MKIQRLIATSVLVVACVPESHAKRPEGYQCTVMTSVLLKDDGKLSVTDYTKGLIGKRFSIDVDTGRVIGSLKNYSDIDSPVLINRGDDKNFFKAITIYRPNPALDVIEVDTSTDQTKKQFIFTRDTLVMTGLCATI